MYVATLQQQLRYYPFTVSHEAMIYLSWLTVVGSLAQPGEGVLWLSTSPQPLMWASPVLDVGPPSGLPTPSLGS